MPRIHTLLSVLLLATVAACSGESTPEGGGGGHSSRAGGPSTSAGGASATGGSAPGAAGTSVGGPAGAPSTGGSASGGSGPALGGSGPAAGGSVSSAGASAGGSSGGRGGAGGMGSVGTAGSSGGSTTAKPSAGCGKSGRPANGKITVAKEEIIDFPTSYDGTKPMPLLIALHACGNENTQWEGLTKGSALETDYVRFMPNTSDSGQCWSNYANNSARILKQYDDILANYCVDTNRVFGVGHSSGAQMLVNILSHKTDAQHLNFKAVAPVAADPFNVALTIPVLYIDGIMDTQRSADSAKNAVAKFRAANKCADTSKPYTAIAGCQSSGKTVDPGCIIYDNCMAPTIWCAHNDPNYSNTYHGVPCFGVKAITDFFKSL